MTIERHRRDGAHLDLVRHGRLVRADRPGRDVAGDPRADHRLAAVLRRPRGADRPARRRRLRDQEGRHELLHGGARDLRVPRLDHRGRRLVRARHPARGPRRLRNPRGARRRTGTGRTTSSCLVCCCTRSRPATATRLRDHLARSPDRQFTMLDCHDGIPVRPDLDGILDAGRDARARGPACSAEAGTSTGSCRRRMPTAPSTSIS